MISEPFFYKIFYVKIGGDFLGKSQSLLILIIKQKRCQKWVCLYLFLNKKSL